MSSSKFVLLVCNGFCSWYTLSLVRFLYMHRTIKLSILYPHDVDINLWRFVQLDVVKYERFKKKVLLLKIKTICIGVWESGPWWVFSHFQCIPACRWNKFKLLSLLLSFAKHSQVTPKGGGLCVWLFSNIPPYRQSHSRLQEKI